MPAGRKPSRKRPRAPSRSTAESRKRDIVEQAIRLMEEKGFAAVSVQHLADALEFSKANFYHHIESKEELLYEIFLDTLRTLESHRGNLERQRLAARQAPRADRVLRLADDRPQGCHARLVQERAPERSAPVHRHAGGTTRDTLNSSTRLESRRDISSRWTPPSSGWRSSACAFLTKLPQTPDSASIVAITRQLQELVTTGLLTPSAAAEEARRLSTLRGRAGSGSSKENDAVEQRLDSTITNWPERSRLGDERIRQQRLDRDQAPSGERRGQASAERPRQVRSTVKGGSESSAVGVPDADRRQRRTVADAVQRQQETDDEPENRAHLVPRCHSTTQRTQALPLVNERIQTPRTGPGGGKPRKMPAFRVASSPPFAIGKNPRGAQDRIRHGHFATENERRRPREDPERKHQSPGLQNPANAANPPERRLRARSREPEQLLQAVLHEQQACNDAHEADDVGRRAARCQRLYAMMRPAAMIPNQSTSDRAPPGVPALAAWRLCPTRTLSVDCRVEQNDVDGAEHQQPQFDAEMRALVGIDGPRCEQQRTRDEHDHEPDAHPGPHLIEDVGHAVPAHGETEQPGQTT